MTWPDLPDELPHDGWGLATWALICIAGLIAFGIYQAVQLKRMRATLGGVRDQVVNGHKVPMRTDLDTLIDAARPR